MGATQEIIYKNYLDIIQYHLIIFLNVNIRIWVYVSVEGTQVSSTLRERDRERESCLNQIAWTFARCNLISYLLSLEFCQKVLQHQRYGCILDLWHLCSALKSYSERLSRTQMGCPFTLSSKPICYPLCRI